MTELIQKKNQYMHEVHVISCIKLGSLEATLPLDGMKENGTGVKRKDRGKRGK